MTLDEHVAIAALAEPTRHSTNGFCLAAFDVHLHEIDATHLTLVEQSIERYGLDLEVRSLCFTGGARTPQLPPCSSKPTNGLDPVPAAAAARTISTCASPFPPTLRASMRRQTWMRFDGDHGATTTNEMRDDEREIAPVGADVYDDHAGGEKPLSNLRLLRLVPSGEARFARDGVAKIADKAPAAEICRQIG